MAQGAWDEEMSKQGVAFIDGGGERSTNCGWGRPTLPWAHLRVLFSKMLLALILLKWLACGGSWETWWLVLSEKGMEEVKSCDK